MSRVLSPGLHQYDTLLPGDHFDTDTATITADLILAFADLTGDRFAIHQSDAGAQKHGFRAQVAHGLLVLSVVEGLKSRAPVQFNGFAALGFDWRFTRAVLANDAIQCRVTVLNKRAAGPRSGKVLLDITVKNQRDEIVQQGQARLMVHRA